MPDQAINADEGFETKGIASLRRPRDFP